MLKPGLYEQIISEQLRDELNTLVKLLFSPVQIKVVGYINNQ